MMYVKPRRPNRRNNYSLSCGVGLVGFAVTVLVLLFVALAGPADLESILPGPFSALARANPTRTLAPVVLKPAQAAIGPVSRTNAPRPQPTFTLAPANGTPVFMPPGAEKPSTITVTSNLHLILGRPVGPDADGVVPEWQYLYGTTEKGALEVHHGIDFLNPLGTPLLAAVDGTVVVAQSDDKPVCGANHDAWCGPQPDFYGNPIVERLDTTFRGQPVYVLYGHLNSIGVQEGQRVKAGQPLGEIGMTGVAQGPHAHLEVRIGADDYAHTRNPYLWLKPLSGHGLLAGRAYDGNGRFVPGAIVDVYDAAGAQEVEWTETYSRDDTAAVNSDDDLNENFVLGDLPVGTYLVRVQLGGQNYYQRVVIQDGQISFLVFRPH